MLLRIKTVFNAQHDATDADKSENMHKVAELEHNVTIFFKFFPSVYLNPSEVHNSH